MLRVEFKTGHVLERLPYDVLSKLCTAFPNFQKLSKTVAYIGGGAIGPWPPPFGPKIFERPRERSLLLKKKNNLELLNAAQTSCDLIECFKSLSFSHISSF